MISNDSITKLIIQVLKDSGRVFPETESDWEMLRNKIENLTPAERKGLNLSENLATFLEQLPDIVSGGGRAMDFAAEEHRGSTTNSMDSFPGGSKETP